MTLSKAKLDAGLPGIATALMRGDNLAIILCSAFDDYDTETEDDTGWSQAARDGYEETISAIRAHYQPLADEITRLRTALAASEAKLQKAREALKPFADDLCKRPWIASHLTWEVDKTNLTNRDLHRAATTLKDIA